MRGMEAGQITRLSWPHYNTPGSVSKKIPGHSLKKRFTVKFIVL